MRNLLYEWNPEPETIIIEEPCNTIQSGVGSGIHYQSIDHDSKLSSDLTLTEEAGIGTNTYTTTAPPP